MFVIFTYRGNDGELRLGVRRTLQLKNEALLEAVSSTDSKLRLLSAVASSLDSRSIFHVCFNPRFVILTVKCTVIDTSMHQAFQFMKFHRLIFPLYYIMLCTFLIVQSFHFSLVLIIYQCMCIVSSVDWARIGVVHLQGLVVMPDTHLVCLTAHLFALII
jgi:hypothetical protein